MGGEAFSHKTAVVTGGGSGIGAACASQLARNGASVVIADIDGEAADEMAEKISAGGGSASAHAVDVTDADSVASMFADVVRQHDAVDIAVNSAGVLGPLAPLGDVPLEAFRRTIEVNVGGVFTCMHYEIQAMLARRGGVIVNIASVAGEVGFPALSAYTASKHAILGLTRSAALEYGGAGIRVVAVAPAGVDTPMLRASPPAMHQAVVEAQVLKRLAQPEEIANLVCFLASNEAAYITGSVHTIDGGYSAQ